MKRPTPVDYVHLMILCSLIAGIAGHPMTAIYIGLAAIAAAVTAS